MAALTTLAVTLAGATPAPVAVAASDTIAESQFGPLGVMARVINAGGSPDTVTVTDPGKTVLGSSPTNPTVSVPATTGVRMIFISRSAIDPATGNATVAHSSTTSVTVELYRV